jgi:hypothetical protein
LGDDLAWGGIGGGKSARRREGAGARLQAGSKTTRKAKFKKAGHQRLTKEKHCCYTENNGHHFMNQLIQNDWESLHCGSVAQEQSDKQVVGVFNDGDDFFGTAPLLNCAASLEHLQLDDIKGKQSESESTHAPCVG